MAERCKIQNFSFNEWYEDQFEIRATLQAYLSLYSNGTCSMYQL